MKIYINDGKGGNWFFVSVPLTDTTAKGHQVLKQALVERKPFPADQTPTMEWVWSSSLSVDFLA